MMKSYSSASFFAGLAWGAGLIGMLAILAAGRSANADTLPGHETIVFVRHGEKPEQGLGQLDCQGLNRALALPAVIEAKYGRPAAIFAPDPAKQKDDGGKAYDYVRPLATIEPAAIRFGLPVDTSYGFAEINKLKDALEQPAYHDATVVVAWEHKIIDVVAKLIVSAHGGDEATVPKWQSADFDSIYVVKISWTGAGATATFELAHEGLDGRSTLCPG
ncbi:MAG: hypothetical protein P4L76_17480 [Beijerinckiaceae bacterium]|nr:hypothetical protein [Beijerinckiaceae bacterium]